MPKPITVSCLPVAGKENPYQMLMMQGLREGGLTVKHGHNSRFFGIFLTAIQQPDFIHFDWETAFYQRRSHWMTIINIPFFILQVWAAKYLFRCTLVWTPHNVTPHDLQHPGVHLFCRRFFAAQMKWIRVFSNTTVQKLVTALHIKPHQCKVVPEGAYVNYYANDTNRADARNKLNIAADQKVLLYLGYIKPYKGISELLEAFEQSFHNEPHTLLLIAGQVMDQDYFKTIETQAGKQVQIIDRFIEDEELQYFMHAADVVVLPFKKIENSGSVILAMGFEKPVIAPNMGVITERLKAQPQLLYQQHISESFEVFKSLTIADLQTIGKQNAKSLEPFQWVDFAKEFTKTC